MKRFRLFIPLVLIALSSAACQPAQTAVGAVNGQSAVGTVEAATDIPPTSTTVPTETPLPTSTQTPAPTSTPTPVPPKKIVVLGVGDVMLGRYVNQKSIWNGDYNWPFYEIADFLREADLAVGNLESSITTDCEPALETMLFCAAPPAADSLAWAGFDGMGFANNHWRDFGIPGFNQTVSYLDEAGVEPFYDEVMAVFEVEGVTIGFLAFDEKYRGVDLPTVEPFVAQKAQEVDILIALVHWGWENVERVIPRQWEVGHGLIDNGVDVIFGAHPHIVQQIEEYNDGLIFFSLGNFVFDAMYDESVRRGGVGKVTFTIYPDGEIEYEYELIWIRIYDYGQPRLEPYDPDNGG